MIKFFRKIRQRLLTENRFSKYLLYAVGEIVLVVIGILIALGVNNWNQDRNERRLGDELLARIHRDVVKDTTDFRMEISRNDELREELKELLVGLYEGVDNMEKVQNMSNIYDQMLDQAFTPNDNTYQSMLSSGNVGLIQNQDLKDQILDLYSEYDQAKVLLQSISDWMIGLVSNMDAKTDFIKFGSSVSDIYTTEEMFNESDFDFLNQKESPEFKLFVRTLSGVAFYQKANNGYRLELINKCKGILKSIEKELKE